MGAHKLNPRSIMKDMLPSLVPAGFVAGTQLGLQVMPQPHILVLPPNSTRTSDNGLEALISGNWEKVPEGVEVWDAANPLPPEKCDVVAVLGTVVQDKTGPVLVAPGQEPRGKASMMLFAELGRAPLVEWQKGHLGALRGNG